MPLDASVYQGCQLAVSKKPACFFPLGLADVAVDTLCQHAGALEVVTNRWHMTFVLQNKITRSICSVFKSRRAVSILASGEQVMEYWVMSGLFSDLPAR